MSAAIAENSIVVFGSDNRDEYGVDPSGRLHWRVPIGNFTYSSPLALAGREVVFGNHSGQLKTVDSDTGRLIRLEQGRGQIWTAAAVDARGDLYFATRDGLIYGFDRAGRRLFAYDAGSPFDGYPARPRRYVADRVGGRNALRDRRIDKMSTTTRLIEARAKGKG